MKRLVVLLPGSIRRGVDEDWLEEVGSVATVVWRGVAAEAEAEMEAFEFAWPG